MPGAVMPLHIFESRYREMTKDVLSSHRMLAVGMLRKPSRDRARPAPITSNAAAFWAARDEGGGQGVVDVVPVVGVGEIVLAQQLAGGRYNIVLRGVARAQLIEEQLTEKPYRLVSAKEILTRSRPRRHRHRLIGILGTTLMRYPRCPRG